jgi:histidinol phosphatase-like enzyme
MSTNKHATIRYLALDQYFRNPGKKYFIEDLVKISAAALLNIMTNQKGVKNDPFGDIKFMDVHRLFN